MNAKKKKTKPIFQMGVSSRTTEKSRKIVTHNKKKIPLSKGSEHKK